MSKRERGRAPYTFPKALREERLEGTGYTCEQCGKHTKNLEVHHIFGAWLASQNPVLVPQIVKSIQNEMCLCPTCHAEANEHQHTWTARDIAFVAWALFDLDPEEVESNQRKTYKDIDDQHREGRSKTKGNRRQRRRRRKYGKRNR